ncbi:MAG: PhzF family phenazine biosynthesis isomerase [Desulfobacterales bacterium]|nr:PhzF family phenazine biosynthesis isomerase [Desulfobacterales bacterium]
MTEYKLYQVDAFTQTRFSGNPAGVVLDARGLEDAQMQAIAREMNNSETAFLFPGDGDNCDGEIRYFTPTMEVPACGHATIALLHALALDQDLDDCILRMKTRIGILPLGIQRRPDGYHLHMTQGEFAMDEPLDGDTHARIMNALGLSSGDMDERCPVQMAGTGHGKVMVGILQRERLHGISPDLAALSRISGDTGYNGFYVFTLDAEPGFLVHGRMFAPASGIAEDPVTGNANGPLGGYLLAHGLARARDGVFSFQARQGEAMGRPGSIGVQVRLDGDRVVETRLEGRAVVVFQTRLKM